MGIKIPSITPYITNSFRNTWKIATNISTIRNLTIRKSIISIFNIKFWNNTF